MKYVFFLVLLLAAACQQKPEAVSKEIDYRSLPAIVGSGINVVVEIPAGTNHDIEFNKDRGVFENVQEDGRDRVVRFLPFPGNYGFIPSTAATDARGARGGNIEVLLLAESRPTGAVVEAIPIGALRLKDAGGAYTRIIAVPVDSTQRLVNATTFRQLLLENDPARRIVEEWFLNYRGFGAMELVSWEDERYARREIEQRALDAVK